MVTGSAQEAHKPSTDADDTVGRMNEHHTPDDHGADQLGVIHFDGH